MHLPSSVTESEQGHKTRHFSSNLRPQKNLFGGQSGRKCPRPTSHSHLKWLNLVSKLKYWIPKGAAGLSPPCPVATINRRAPPTTTLGCTLCHPLFFSFNSLFFTCRNLICLGLNSHQPQHSLQQVQECMYKQIWGLGWGGRDSAAGESEHSAKEGADFKDRRRYQGVPGVCTTRRSILKLQH